MHTDSREELVEKSVHTLWQESKLCFTPVSVRADTGPEHGERVSFHMFHVIAVKH